MHRDREHPLYYLEAETLLVATHVWVDDGFKALQAQGFKLPPKQKRQKATLALFLLLQGQDLATQTTLKAYFPSLPFLSGPAKGPGAAGLPGHRAFRGRGLAAGGGSETTPPGPRPPDARPQAA